MKKELSNYVFAEHYDAVVKSTSDLLRRKSNDLIIFLIAFVCEVLSNEMFVLLDVCAKFEESLKKCILETTQ